MTISSGHAVVGHAVVAGGAGFIGAHLCRRLLAAGWRVTCLDDLLSGRQENLAALRPDPNFGFVDHDVTTELPDLGQVDVVFHLASAASPAYYLRHPVATLRAGAVGTERLLELTVRTGARFVLTSTSEVYGDPLQHPQREDYWGNVNPIGPRSVYDEAKRYAEALTMAVARSSHADVAIARLFNTYGPGMRADDGRMIPAFIDHALRGEPLLITGTGEQTRSTCYVDDTVSGLIALMDSDISGPVNLGNPDERTVNEIADLVRSMINPALPVRHVDRVADDPQRRCPDITLARRELGWKPEIALADGLRRTIDWFAASPRAA